MQSLATLEPVSKSTWNVHGKIKQLYGLLHKAKTFNEREEIMRRVIQFPPEYESVFKNLIADVNNTFMTDENCYSQFKNILLSFQQEVVDDSGELIHFKIKIKSPSKSPGKPKSPSKSPGKPKSPSKSPGKLKSPSKSPGKPKSPSKSPGKPKSPSKSPGKLVPTCVLPTPLTHSSQNSVSNLSDLKLGIFCNAFITCSNSSERTKFIKKYIYASKSNGDSFHEFVNDISEDMVDTITNVVDEELSETQMRNRLIDHLKYANDNAAKNNESIFILYPFPRIHMMRKGKISVHNLGGGKGKRKFTRKRKV